MACALTQGYNLDCRDSAGGVKSAYFIPFDSVTTVTVTAGVVTAITKAVGSQFYKYNLIKQTGLAEETLEASEENGTVFWNQSIKFPANKLQTAVRNEIVLLAQNRLMGVVVDQNGKGWLYGYQNALMLNSGTKTSTGTKMGDRNGYELELAGVEVMPAFEVNSSVILTLETPGA